MFISPLFDNKLYIKQKTPNLDIHPVIVHCLGPCPFCKNDDQPLREILKVPVKLNFNKQFETNFYKCICCFKIFTCDYNWIICRCKQTNTDYVYELTPGLIFYTKTNLFIINKVH